MEEGKEKKVFSVGDINPIYQVVGFEVVKRIKNGEPVVIQTQSQSEAEILSALFRLGGN